MRRGFDGYWWAPWNRIVESLLINVYTCNMWVVIGVKWYMWIVLLVCCMNPSDFIPKNWYVLEMESRAYKF